jgi:hypothetical protein
MLDELTADRPRERRFDQRGGFVEHGRYDDSRTRDQMTDAERLQDEAALDEAIEESFPASDAPANTVETGVGPPPPSADGDDPASLPED